MVDYNNVLFNLLKFIVFAIITIVIAIICLKVFTKEFSFTTKNSRFYGIFYNLSNKGIIALSLTSVTYLFLVWNAMMTQELNWVYGSIIILLPLTSLMLVKNYIKLPLQLIVSLINCFAIYIIHFAHIYLSGEVEDIFMRIAIFFMISFAFIYFTYNYFNDVSDIAKADKERVG